MATFPHMGGNDFPYVEDVNTDKYVNNFDYSKYDKTQMKITVCAVPWDVGLIHVGNAQIGGLGNVVYFDSKDDRDNWLDELENKYTWETKYREYHTGLHIEVPLPYEKCVLYNYCYVEYTTLPVEYAEGGKERFFFFIRSCESLAPNTCKIELLRDTWQTYIYDVTIKNMMLERGHAPMSLTSADDYLNNPIDNNNYLLAEDVNFGSSYRSRFSNSVILNSGDMWAVVVTSGNPQGSWGSKSANTWNTPNGVKLQDGQPAMYAFACEPENLSTLLTNLDRDIPQFIQTIKGVFFILKRLVTRSTSFTLADVQCYMLEQRSSTFSLANLNKELFGYDARYQDLAKLYTYPYAFLEVADDSGNVNQIRIEETSGNLSLQVTSSLAYPWLTLDAHISGVGSGSSSITFSNVTDHTFAINGEWYKFLKRWEIPTFAVTQSAAKVYDYSTHFDRLQRALENTTAEQNARSNATTNKANADANANTAYDNAAAQALTAKNNADRIAATNKGNADRSALAARDNQNALATTSQTNANASADTTRGNQTRDIAAERRRVTLERGLAQAQLNLLTAGEYSPGYSGFIGASAWENIQKLGDDWDSDFLMAIQVATAQQYETAMSSTLNAASGAGTGIALGAAGGALAGGLMGAGVGAVSGLVGGTIQLATASASIPLAISTDQAIVDAANTAGSQKTDHAINYIRNMATLQSNLEINKKTNEDTYIGLIADQVRDVNTADADDTQATTKANATRNYNTDTANATRTYNAAIANNADAYNADIANNAASYNTAIANADRSKTTALNNNALTETTDLAIATRNKDTADLGILRAIQQAALEAPKTFGEFSNGDTSTTRPMGAFVNVVTQSDDLIEQTGDYFLRFGYAVNRAWHFTSWHMMPRFTYWKCSDIWVSGNNVPDAYLDEIRFYLLGGVCVWKNPDDIGNISIYENN